MSEEEKLWNVYYDALIELRQVARHLQNDDAQIIDLTIAYNAVMKANIHYNTYMDKENG